MSPPAAAKRFRSHITPRPVGQVALHTLLDSKLPLPAVRSYVQSGARRTVAVDATTEEYYSPDYAPDDTLRGHLRFALRYEPCDLGIIHAALVTMGPSAVADWVREEPTGIYSRRAWFFYETLTGDRLPLGDTAGGNYVEALRPDLHYVAPSRNSPRHRVRDNLLGTGELCPTLRRTPKLEAMRASRLDREVSRLTGQYAPEMLARAANFLYTRETRSSFALEGEAPSPKREERFLYALHHLARFDPPDKVALLALQETIVEARYAARDWRDFQNFVGETTRDMGDYVHFICPRPPDVPGLMQGWMALTERVAGGGPEPIDPLIDPVLAAAVSAFAFVFIHPFEDGNGRLHRFLMHYLFYKRGFAPPDVVFPVSTAILRHQRGYHAVLEAFSRPALKATEWEFADDNSVLVTNDTRDLYRFFDATPQAEYLYDRVAETIREDFKDELDFLTVYDAAFTAVRGVVELPDRRAALFIKLCLQNKGHLSHNKRGQFAELTDAEVAAMEAHIQSLLQPSGDEGG